MSNLNLNFYVKKNARQELAYNDVFLSKDKKYIHCYGGSRSGKTFLVIEYLIDCCLRYAGSRHLVFRKNYSSLRMGVIDQTIPNLFKIFAKNSNTPSFFDLKIGKKPFVKWSDDKHKLVFFNESEIVFFGVSQASTGGNSIEKVLSTEWGNILIEEANENENYDVIDQLKTRLTQLVSDCNGELMPCKMFSTENPTSFKSWTYQVFFEKKHPSSKENIKNPEQYQFLKFSPEDNLENLTADYLETLGAMSPRMRQRFLYGEYGDHFDGEIFKNLYYQDVDWEKMEKVVIYADPSYKSGKHNDYKAVVTCGISRGTLFLLNCMAVKGTTYEMIGLLHRQQEVASAKIGNNSRISIKTYIEGQGLADDFNDSFKKYCEKHHCLIPYQFDHSKKGDKFTRIESTLVPLNEQGLFYVSKELLNTPHHEQIEVQFLNFSQVPKKGIHDDIPDAVHGAAKILMNSQGVNFGKKDMLVVDLLKGRGY